MAPKIPDSERFQSFIDKRGGDNACWPWRGSINHKGYGTFTTGWREHKRNYRAHRYAYALAFGEIPGGLHVLHRCDRRDCVNPAHLFLGTNRDNVLDRL